MYLQSKLGPRFFIPGFMLPPKFNYFVRVSVDQENIEDQVLLENITAI